MRTEPEIESGSESGPQRWSHHAPTWALDAEVDDFEPLATWALDAEVDGFE